MKIKVLYDNEAKRDLESDWGFSALIEAEENILFDTGDNGDLLKRNIEKMDVDVSKVKKIVLSHEHHDHTGGLFSILDRSMEVYVPESFSTQFKKEVRGYGSLVEVSGKRKISHQIFTTGEIGKSIKEQSLMIEVDDGYILLTGCAHPGLARIVDEASRYGDIKGVIGGFHGFKDLDALKNISFIVPCHCTEYKDRIKDKYPSRSMDCFAGLELDVGGE